MDIEHVREFIVLADILNFTEASRNLSISQSTLSKHIKLMESKLGVSLFIRDKGNLELSEFGEMFLPYAKIIDKSLSEYEQIVFAKLHNISENLIIGSIPSISYYGITELISGFIQENKDVTVDIIELDNRTLVDYVRQNRCDFAFARDEDDRYSDIERILVTEDYCEVLVPTDNPLSSKKSVTLEELKDERFLMGSKNEFYYELCKKAGFEPRVIYSTNRGRALITLLEQGIGIAFMNSVLAEAWKTPKVKAVELVPRVYRGVYLYYNRSKEMTPVMNAFLDFVKERIGEETAL